MCPQRNIKKLRLQSCHAMHSLGGFRSCTSTAVETGAASLHVLQRRQRQLQRSKHGEDSALCSRADTVRACLLLDRLFLKGKRRAELDLAAPSGGGVKASRQAVVPALSASFLSHMALPIDRVRPVGRIRGRKEVVGGGDLSPAQALLMAPSRRRQRTADRKAFGATGQHNYSRHARPGPSLHTSDLIP